MIVGIPVLRAAFVCPVLPHIIPNMANNSPDIPEVGQLTDIGKKLTTKAIPYAAVISILLRTVHSTAKLHKRCHTLTCRKEYIRRGTTSLSPVKPPPLYVSWQIIAAVVSSIFFLVSIFVYL